MKDFSRVLYRVLLVLPLLLSVGARTNAAGNDESRAASAIFSRYETVFYTNADLSSRFSFFKGLSRQSAGTLALPFGYLIGALDSLNPHASEEILGKTDSLLVGVRDFTRPQAAGSAAQLGAFAYVASFGKQGIPRLDKYFNQVSVTSVGGHSVWRWLGKIYGEDQEGTEIYVAQVDNSHMVFATDLEDLQAIAKSLTSADDGSGVLSKIPEWLAVSQHEYWGYRHAPNAGVVDEGAGMMMPGAETVIMFADIKKKTATVQVLGVHASEYLETVKKRDEQQLEAFKRLAAGRPIPPLPVYSKFKASDARTLKKIFSLAGAQSEADILTAMGLFGFEILI